MSSDSKKPAFLSSVMIEKLPTVRYDTYFAIFGLLSVQLNASAVNPIRSGATVNANDSSNVTATAGNSLAVDGSSILKRTWLRYTYCRTINTFLWLFTLRTFILLFIRNRVVKLYMGDFTIYWNDYQMYYLIPMFFLSLQTAITSSLFLSKEKNLAWLVPFFSIKQTLSAHQHSDRYYRVSTRNFRLRMYLGISFGMTYVALVTSSVTMVYLDTARNSQDMPMAFLMPWIVLHGTWFFYMSGILVFSMLYLNLVCKVIAQRFFLISKDIERLAEQETMSPQTKSAALNSLYFEHNEVCELVDEANSFWSSYIFNTYATFIPGACYTLYCLFFAQWDTLLSATLWSVFTTTVSVVSFISISAAGIASEAHAPYTPLHTLSLLQLPMDLEVNMSTFLHRVRGPMIGFSCMDLFVVTNSSISSTVAAVASYFLIVADFSRSTASYTSSNKNDTTLDVAKQIIDTAIENITTK